MVEYELDSEDEEFAEREQLSYVTLERAIDACEKRCFDHRQRTASLHSNSNAHGNSNVPDDHCAVCMDPDYDDNNLIVFCDGCKHAFACVFDVRMTG